MQNEVLVRLELSGMPISVNSMYPGLKRRFKSKTTKVLNEAWMWEIKGQMMSIEMPEIKPSDYLALDIRVLASKWKNKNGTIKKIDISNLIKFTEDVVAKSLRFDDCQFWTVTASKEMSVEEKTIVTISRIV